MSKGLVGLMKLAVGGVVTAAAVLSGSLVSAGMANGSAAKNKNTSSAQTTSKPEKKEKVDPITPAIKEAADACTYSYVPDDVIIKQLEDDQYDFSDPELKTSNYGADKRSADHNLVYAFEGTFSEGYHGGYGTYSAYIYLWDDGLFFGDSNGSKFCGFWYNSSLEFGVDDNGQDVADCLNMFCDPNNNDYSNFKSIITDPVKGFYQRQGLVYLNPGWGKRTVVVSGYRYYPDVAIFIDTDEKTEFKTGEVFDRDEFNWAANRVIKNLNYAPVVDTTKVIWTYPEGMLSAKNKFLNAGEYEIKAKWGEFESSVKITVTGDPYVEPDTSDSSEPAA